MPDPGSHLSRRDSLKKAAGALALGLGAPAALAADGDAPLYFGKLELYTDPDGRAEGFVALPGDLAEKLMGRDGLIVIKRIKYVNPETGRAQDFQVRGR